MKNTLFNLQQLHNLIKAYGFIAGGACRASLNNEEIKDFDIFCFSKESYEPLKAILADMYGDKRENELVYQVANIQLIKPRESAFVKTYGQPIEVISKFDFTVARSYTLDGKTFQWIDEEFEQDLISKNLRIKNIVCPISTLKRVIKYCKRGYFIKTRSIIQLFSHFKDMKVEDDFFNQLGDLMNESDSDDELYAFLNKYGID